MPISESLISTLGTFSTWAGGNISATSNGITSASSNSYAKSSATMASSNTYQRIKFTCKIGSNLMVGIRWDDTFPHGIGSNLYFNGTNWISRVTKLGVGDYDATVVPGLSAGDVITMEFEYDNGNLRNYINGTLYAETTGNYSAYSTWKPYLWMNTTSDYIQAYEEDVGNTSVTITPDALTLTSVVNDGTISTVRNITTQLSEQTLTSSQPVPTVVLTKNITVITTVQSLTSSQPNCTVYPLSTTYSNVVFIVNREKFAIKIGSSGKNYWELD